MSKNDNQRYYWLKLPLDFFDSDKIKLLKGYPNGSEYVIFYLRLLLMAANREGMLRLDDILPYSPETLAILTDTNVDIVKGALEALETLRMIEVLSDQTIFMSQIENLVGSETRGALRKREYRENQQKTISGGDNVPLMSPECPREIDIEKEKDREIDIEKEKGISTGVDIPKEKDELSLIPTPESKPKKERKRFIPPTVEEVAAYCRERGNNIDAEAFVAHYSARNWIPKGYTKQMTNWKAAVITWEKYDQKRAQEQKPTRSASMSAFDQFRQQEGLGPATSIFGG